jgi:hypothetical protein
MIQQLSADDLDERVMGWLSEAAKTSLDSADVSLYTTSISTGALGVWLLWNEAIIGLSRTNKVLFVEFLVGKSMTPRRKEILGWLKGQAAGRRVEALPSRIGMVRRLEQLGFKPVSTLMRLES